MDAKRIPPNSVPSEQALLGAVLQDNRVYQGQVSPEAFYRGAHRLLWAAVGSMVATGDTADALTITERLRRDGALEKCGGAAYVSSLTSACPSVSHAPHYAAEVLQQYARRLAITAAAEVVEEAYGLASVDELSAKLHRAGNELSPKTSRLQPIKVLLREVAADLERLSQQEELPGLSTGFADLDRITRLQRGELTVVAGRPGMGKSAFAMDMTRAALFDQRKVFWASLEMTRHRLTKRLLSSLSGIEGSVFRSARFRDQDWGALSHALGRLAHCKLWIDDTPQMGSGHIRTAAHRIAAEWGGLDLIVVDYVQLMQEPGSWNNQKRLEVAQSSHNMISLAKELDAHVVLLSQLGRQVDARKPQIPQISDLKEAGDLEQDADNIFLLYREEYYKKEDTPEDRKGIGEIHVGKCRDGETGCIEVLWEGSITSYRPLERYR